MTTTRARMELEDALKKAAEERMKTLGISTLTGYINALIGRDISKRK